VDAVTKPKYRPRVKDEEVDWSQYAQKANKMTHARALRMINEVIRDGCMEPVATGWIGKVGY
jgi:hypothetical protein